MEKIGNIITGLSSDNFIELFNIYTDCTEVEDDTLPTLIIGVDKARKCIDNFSVLKKRYGNDLWWTFNRTEDRNAFYDVLRDFSNSTIKNALDKNRCVYIDILNYGLGRIKNLINYINNKDKKYCFLTTNSNFIFIFDPSINIVFGFSLTLIEYIGINRYKVVKKIKNNDSNIFIYDLSFINSDLRSIIGENTHYIPILYKYFNKE